MKALNPPLLIFPTASCSTTSPAAPPAAVDAGPCSETVAEYCDHVGGCQLTWASARMQCTASSDLYTCGGLDHAAGPHHDYYDHAASAQTPIACGNVADAGDGG